ncbi:MAG TPA: ATP-binding protein [Geothrix sp.]|nr:ATP-binding protein [Geothrix sp.]
MIPRLAGTTLVEMAQGFPFLALTGPRQSGKTTLARAMFPEKPYVSLEDPDARDFADGDPRGFLAQFPDGAVLDEVQRCPALFSYLQTLSDLDGRPGLFVLTGSQQFGLFSGLSQTLAGRVGLVQLLPFSSEELTVTGSMPPDLDGALSKGMYPPLYDRTLDPGRWFASYVATYVERDVRQMVNVRDLSTFQRFVRLCAGRTGQLLNLSGLASDAGITHNTAKAWVSILEASYLVHLLAPHHENFNKRLVKTPKLYFLDTGLAAWLLGIQEPGQLATHPLRGPLFETWVVAELLKRRFNRGLPSNLSFWRDRGGREVDVLMDEGTRLVPVEIKAGRTVNADFFAGLKAWTALAGPRAGRGRLVYGGDSPQARSEMEVLSWRNLTGLTAEA